MKQSALKYALYLLEMRDRSEAEIRKKMTEKEYLAEEIDKTILWLKDKKFIDDERFVDNYLKLQAGIGKSGRYKIKFKLQNLGIDRELIEEKLAGIDPDIEFDQAHTLTEKWLARKEIPKEKKYEKVGRFLAGRGYSLDIVHKVLNSIIHNS